MHDVMHSLIFDEPINDQKAFVLTRSNRSAVDSVVLSHSPQLADQMQALSSGCGSQMLTELASRILRSHS